MRHSDDVLLHRFVRLDGQSLEKVVGMVVIHLLILPVLLDDSLIVSTYYLLFDEKIDVTLVI